MRIASLVATVLLIALTGCQCGGPTGPGLGDASSPRYDSALGDQGSGSDATGADHSGADASVPDSSGSDASAADTASGTDADISPDAASDPDAASTPDAAVAPDAAVPDATICANACAAEGASRCDGNAVVTCEIQSGCLAWSSTQACPAGTSCSDGRCKLQCSDECSEAGATRCAAASQVETCGQHDSDPCLEWGAPQTCPGSEVCASGRCQTSCSDACTAPGARRCTGNSVEQCGDLNGDSCLDWGLVLACGEGETCSLGVCAPRCDDECTTAGARACDGIGYRQCGNVDSDACLEWGTTVACSEGTSCSGGVCQVDCFDECSPAGALGCQGNATRRCGNFDVDACLEWGTTEPCAQGTACSGGVCALTCQDECTRPGAVECHLGGTHSCANYDDDPCLEWSDVLPCPAGNSCSNGICLPSCSDECSAGQQRCEGTATYQTCASNFDLDPCLDWGPSLACPTATPHCEESVVNQASCVAQCEDLCSSETAATCYDGTATIACALQSNSCYDWQITACAPDHACMGDSCVGCSPDAREPNNTQSAATPIGSLPFDAAALSICAKDQDWFAYTATAGENFDVAIRFSHDLGDLDLEVYDPNGELAGSSSGVIDDETVAISSTQAGTYLIQVYGYAAMANHYSLEVSAYSCADDLLEPNDSGLAASTLTSAPHQVTTLELCRGNEDWFSYTASQGEGLLIEVLYTGSGDDLTIEVFDPSGTSLGIGNPMDSGESFAVGSMVAGDYLILVDGGYYQGGNSYTLNLAGYSCTSDAREPNNSSATASALALPSTVAELQICAADRDWFVYTASAGDSIKLDALFLQTDADLDLRAYDAQLEVLDRGISSSDNESVVLWHLDAGDYYFEVEGWLDQETAPYALQASVPTGCAEDAREPNDSSGTAFHIASLPFGANGLAVCNPDVDWFSFDASEGQDIEIRIQFTNATGNLDLTVYDDLLQDVGHSYSWDDDEYVVLYGMTAGRYLVAVDGPGDSNPSYDLSISAAAPCTTDGLEPNSDSGAATTVTSLPYEQLALTLCSPDEDWFAYTASPGQSVLFEILFQDALADLDLHVYDNQLNNVGSGMSVSDNESVTLEDMAGVTYYLQVKSFDGRSTHYELYIDLL